MFGGVPFLLCVLGVNLAREVPLLEPLSDEMIHYINNHANTTWKAGRNFNDIPLSTIRRMCGALKNPSGVRPQVKNHVIDNSVSIPTSFDPRRKWPNCLSLRRIHDQGNCGSCWAFAAVTAMTDRVCIASNGTLNANISAEDLVSCCGRYCGKGCEGGFAFQPWKFFEHIGIVTGGQYSSEEGCRPYTIPGCSHFENGTLPRCNGTATTPACVTQCEANYSLSYRKDKHRGASTYTILSDEKQIQSELMSNGPVHTSFTVYADFLSYKSGIYQHRAGKVIGQHAVRLLGWGAEYNTPFWLLANSWNTEWGDNGYFKILRGCNESGIETELVAGIPKLLPYQGSNGMKLQLSDI